MRNDNAQKQNTKITTSPKHEKHNTPTPNPTYHEVQSQKAQHPKVE
jgi:hypothetical protein